MAKTVLEEIKELNEKIERLELNKKLEHLEQEASESTESRIENGFESSTGSIEDIGSTVVFNSEVETPYPEEKKEEEKEEEKIGWFGRRKTASNETKSDETEADETKFVTIDQYSDNIESNKIETDKVKSDVDFISTELTKLSDRLNEIELVKSSELESDEAKSLGDSITTLETFLNTIDTKLQQVSARMGL